MTILLGNVATVVASTPDAAREILRRNDVECSGRTTRDAATSMNDHDSAVIWIQPNQEWRTFRKALKTCLTQKQKLDTLSGLRQNVVGAMLNFLREPGRNNKTVDMVAGCLGEQWRRDMEKIEIDTDMVVMAWDV
nr:geraniol 8-hydroxylase-like [Tanacetum cinerariifolium]